MKSRIRISNQSVHRIPTNFEMPKDYEKRFLWIGKSVKMEIQAEPPSHLKVTQVEMDDILTGEERSRCLDWIQEAIETIRVEVGADE